MLPSVNAALSLTEYGEPAASAEQGTEPSMMQL
jgi:hypothetical protein